MRRDSIIVYIMETILKLAIAFEKKYTEKLVATRIVYILKDVIGSDFLTRISA